MADDYHRRVTAALRGNEAVDLTELAKKVRLGEVELTEERAAGKALDLLPTPEEYNAIMQKEYEGRRARLEATLNSKHWEGTKAMNQGELEVALSKTDLKVSKFKAQILDAAGSLWMRGNGTGEIYQVVDVDGDMGIVVLCDANFQPCASHPEKVSLTTLLNHCTVTQTPSEMEKELKVLKRVFEHEIRELQVRARADRLNDLYSPEGLTETERGTALTIGAIKLPTSIDNRTLCDIQLGIRVTQYVIVQGYSAEDSPSQILRVGAQLCERLREMSFCKVACRVSKEDPYKVQFYLCGDTLPAIPPKFAINLLTKRGW